jgi:hypothetical protein
MGGEDHQYLKQIRVNYREIAELIEKELKKSFEDLSVSIFNNNDKYDLYIITSLLNAPDERLIEYSKAVDKKIGEILTGKQKHFEIIKNWNFVNS